MVGPTTGPRPGSLRVVRGDAEILPGRGPILAQGHTISPRRLTLQRGLERQQRRPQVLAGPPISEPWTLTERVEHSISDS